MTVHSMDKDKPTSQKLLGLAESFLEIGTSEASVIAQQAMSLLPVALEQEARALKDLRRERSRLIELAASILVASGIGYYTSQSSRGFAGLIIQYVLAIVGMLVSRTCSALTFAAYAMNKYMSAPWTTLSNRVWSIAGYELPSTLNVTDAWMIAQATAQEIDEMTAAIHTALQTNTDYVVHAVAMLISVAISSLLICVLALTRAHGIRLGLPLIRIEIDFNDTYSAPQMPQVACGAEEKPAKSLMPSARKI